MRHLIVLFTALALPAAAGAQTTQFQLGAQPALEVQRLAPQLVAFAGGDVNFNNLVNGLALGLPVTLTSATAPRGAQPALEVQRLAPQLVAFAGGDVNFNNLVNGLALGLPVTLTSATAPGVTQVVTFT